MRNFTQTTHSYLREGPPLTTPSAFSLTPISWSPATLPHGMDHPQACVNPHFAALMAAMRNLDLNE